MVDLAPEGFTSLVEFYDRFALWMWEGHSAFEELELERRVATLPGERVLAHQAALGRVSDKMLSQAVGLFDWGKLEATIIDPKDGREKHLSSKAWERAFFPQRMFLSDTIEVGHGPEFDAAAGRTPFVRIFAVDEALRDLAHSEYRHESRALLRDCLLGLVMDGVLIDGDAEAMAKRWGLPPFESHPPQDKYDPRKVAVWTLPLAVIWIAWRDYATVREAMDEYRADSWEWFGINRRLPIAGGAGWYEVEGEELRTLDPVSLFTIGLQEALDVQSVPERMVMSVKSAREELWSRLTANDLVATGINSSGDVIEIPSREWAYIVLNSDDRMRDRLMFRNTNKPAYRDVTLLRTDLISLWPTIQNSQTWQFDVTAKSWSLLEASIWVGCKGEVRSSEEIAREDLEEKGAYELFAVLSDGARLEATGLNRKRIRESIPAEYWELATLDPAQFRQRHYVSFIDDILREHGGQLTPFGENDPRWFGIRIDRTKLFAAFVKFDRSGTGAEPLPPRVKKPRKLEAARAAINALFKSGFPEGLGDKERLEKVNGWLTANGHSAVSLRTMTRAATGR